MSITRKPSEILTSLKALFDNQVYEGIPDYLWADQVLEMEQTLSEEVLESVLFLSEDQPNVFKAFKENPARERLSKCLKELAQEQTTWPVVSKAWENYIEEAKKIEDTSLEIRVEKFTYRGFEVCTIQTPPHVLDIFKKAIDFLIELFKTKEVQIDLHTIINRFEFRPNYKTDKLPRQLGYAGGYYRDGVVSLFWGSRSPLSPSENAKIRGQLFNLVHYVIVHEVAHAIYFRALSPEARKFWVSDWVRLQVEIDDLEDVIDPDMNYTEVLKELGIPTQYGHMNPKEDFAETLTHYILDNDSLAPYAKNRLLGTLNHESNSSRIFKSASVFRRTRAVRPSIRHPHKI